MFEPRDLNNIEKAIESEVHVNDFEGNFRHNHFARRAFMLAFLNLRYPEQDMVRETVDDLQLFQKDIKLTPPSDRKNDMEHARYPQNSYLQREWGEKKLRILRIKALHFLAGFGIIEFVIVKPWFQQEKLTITKFSYEKNHALYHLLKEHLYILDEKVASYIKNYKATGNKLIYNPETEIGIVEDAHGKKIHDLSFRENSNPVKFFNHMWSKKGTQVTYNEIREILKLRVNQRATVTQWVKQMKLQGFFKIDSQKELVKLIDFEEIEVTP